MNGLSPVGRGELAAEEARWIRAEHTVANAQRSESLRALRQATEEVEALFLVELLREMRRTVVRAGMLDGGMAEQIFTQQWDTEIARQLAQRTDAGIAEPLYQQLKRHIE